MGISLTVKCRNCKVGGAAFSLSPVPPRTTLLHPAMSELDADLYGGKFVIIPANIILDKKKFEQTFMAMRI